MILSRHFKSFDLIVVVKFKNNSFVEFLEKEAPYDQDLFLFYDIKDFITKHSNRMTYAKRMSKILNLNVK